MRSEAPRLRDLVPILEKLHGRFRPEVTHPFEMALWENVAYLVPDVRRRGAFDLLRRKVGLTPAAKAKRLFKRFPGFGDPGAEKILLFNEAAPIPALESNGLRVLLRLGFGEASKSYAKSYRPAQEAIMKEEPGPRGSARARPEYLQDLATELRGVPARAAVPPLSGRRQTLKLSPQPHARVAFGFRNWNPAPRRPPFQSISVPSR